MGNNTNKAKKQANKTNARVSVVVACILIACCVGFFGYNGVKSKQTNNFIDSVKNTSMAPINDINSSDNSDVNVTLQNPINFGDLQENNGDLYSWIYVPNTSVDYPVAQNADDDSFYLHRGTDKSYYFAGTIYTESAYNSTDYNDRNTVLYGHNMLDGSMFATLHKFEDENFFNENEYFYIYTPDRILTYKIFAAYEVDDRHILKTHDFSDDSVWSDYLNEISNPQSDYTCNSRDIELSLDSKIVTLSTCTNFRANDRYIVQGVLVDEQTTV